MRIFSEIFHLSKEYRFPNINYENTTSYLNIEITSTHVKLKPLFKNLEMDR